MTDITQAKPLLNSHSVSNGDTGNVINSGKMDVSSDLVILNVYDSECQKLLGENQLINKSFAEILLRRVTPEDYFSLTKVFDKIINRQDIFDHHIEESPFECLEIKYINNQDVVLTRYVRCEFEKHADFDRNEIWTITIFDISKSVRVANVEPLPLDNTEIKINTVMSLIQYDKDLIGEFLQSTVSSLKDMLMYLTRTSHYPVSLQCELESMYCLAHQIKGDSAMLNLNVISDQMHGFEQYLSSMNGNPNLSTEDFFPLKKPLKLIVDSVKEVNLLFDKINDGGWNTTENYGGDSLIRQIKHLLKKVSADQHKRVILIDDGYIDSAIPLNHRRLVGRVLIQLARNSVVHGIEGRATRKILNKTEYGCFHVSVKPTKKNLTIIVRDDGAGINIKEVKDAALSSGLFDPGIVMGWDQEQTMMALFKPGFSTAKKVTEHAGRGVGLDVIKTSVEKIGGHISIKSVVGQFTEFTLSFPTLNKVQ